MQLLYAKLCKHLPWLQAERRAQSFGLLWA